MSTARYFYFIYFWFHIELEEDLEPYSTVLSGSCESEGMKTISKLEDCEKIANGLRKIGYKSEDDRGFTRKYVVDTWASLFLPYGCLYSDNRHKGLFWNPAIAVQKSLPCGSIWEGHRYNYFCVKQSNINF